MKAASRRVSWEGGGLVIDDVDGLVVQAVARRTDRSGGVLELCMDHLIWRCMVLHISFGMPLLEK